MKTRHLIILIGLVINIYATEKEDTSPPASIVNTVTVKEGDFNSLQNYVGTLYYDRHSAIASESSGVVKKVFVEEGQQVKWGDKLLELESSVLKAQVNAKESLLNAMISKQIKQGIDLKRATALLERKSISQSSFDTTYYALDAFKSQVKALKSELKALQIELQKKIIFSPFSGVIVQKNIDIGEWVAVGSSVYTIVDPKSIEAKINIPSKLLSTVYTNQQLFAEIDGQTTEVKIKTIIPLADQINRTFPIKLSLQEKSNSIEGMRIDVKVPILKKQKVLLVPRDAVIKRFGNFVVFAVVDEKAVMLPITVLGYEGSQAAISSKELRANMNVITKGNERIFPNMLVAQKDK